MSARTTTTELPSIARLFELLEPDFEAGTLTWKVDRGGSAKVGTIAGSVKPVGYTYVSIAGRHYLAHRLILAMYQGAWPADTELVDHINGVKSDNRIGNLRLVSQMENLHNRARANRDSTSGFPGVSWRKEKGKWRACIRANGRRFHIGYFDSKLDAALARIDAKARLHPSTPASTIATLKQQVYVAVGEYREFA